MPPSLSVMVMTSPGREALLERCLQRLAAQSDTDFELLVVDDGSEGSEAILLDYESCFADLVYLWRENDRHVSISRNLGAAAAQGEWLISLDSDLLLQAEAIAAYRGYAARLSPRQLLYGYYGHAMQACSQWFPEVEIIWIDPRILTSSIVEHARFNSQDFLAEFYEQALPGLWTPRSLRSEPELYAAGGNFMMHRDIPGLSGGFDESLARWEDLAFGMSLSRNGCEIHFTPDTWAEHQCHGHQSWGGKQELAYRRFYDDYADLPAIDYDVQVFCRPEALAGLDLSCGFYAGQGTAPFGLSAAEHPPRQSGRVLAHPALRPRRRSAAPAGSPRSWSASCSHGCAAGPGRSRPR